MRRERGSRGRPHGPCYRPSGASISGRENREVVGVTMGGFVNWYPHPLGTKSTSPGRCSSSIVGTHVEERCAGLVPATNKSLKMSMSSISITRACKVAGRALYCMRGVATMCSSSKISITTSSATSTCSCILLTYRW